MNVVKGVVKVIRVGRGVSVQMDDGTWYGAGFDVKDISFKEGNTIQFIFTEKGVYKNIDLKTVEILDASEVSNSKPLPPSKEVGTKQSFSTDSRDGYWAKKDEKDDFKSKEIRYLAANSRAIEFVKLAVENGAISLGAQAKKKMEVLEAAVRAYTHLFYKEAVDAYNGDLDKDIVEVNNIEEVNDPSYE